MNSCQKIYNKDIPKKVLQAYEKKALRIQKQKQQTNYKTEVMERQQ